MMPTEKQILIASQMLQMRNAMKRLYDDRWPEVSAPYRQVLSNVMNRSGNFNPLSVALPIAKDLQAKGHNPLLLLAVAALPVTVVEPGAYASKVPEARRRIGGRDPDDVELLALALHEDVPVWSNDNDFENAGVDWYTTAELLRKLGA